MRPEGQHARGVDDEAGDQPPTSGDHQHRPSPGERDRHGHEDDDGQGRVDTHVQPLPDGGQQEQEASRQAGADLVEIGEPWIRHGTSEGASVGPDRVPCASLTPHAGSLTES